MFESCKSYVWVDNHGLETKPIVPLSRGLSDSNLLRRKKCPRAHSFYINNCGYFIAHFSDSL